MTSAQNVVFVHACTPSVAVSTDWQPSQWQSAANRPKLQRGAASTLLTRHFYTHYLLLHDS